MSIYDKYFSDIKKLHELGKRTSEISRMLGIDGRRVSDQLKKNGLKSNEKIYSNKPTKNQEDVLTSLAIGDGCIYKSKGNKNYRMNLAHSQKQKYYFLEKYNQLKSFIETDYFIETQTHSKTGNKHTCYKFQTRVHPYYTEMHKKFYDNGKKIIPENFSEILNEKIIAYKYFDDGHKMTSGYSLAMHDYDKESIEILKKAILKNFAIECNIHGEKSIYIPSIYRNEFTKILLKYATKDLEYKLFL